MLMKLTSGVNFINVFLHTFFVQKIIEQLILVEFWQFCMKKRAHKMLMKLTQGVKTKIISNCRGQFEQPFFAKRKCNGSHCCATFGFTNKTTPNLPANSTRIFAKLLRFMLYASVVQPCRHSTHVATGTFNVATSTISLIS